MLDFWYYLPMLLLILFFWYICLNLSYYSPKKIRTYSVMVLMILIFRYMALLIMFFADNIKLLYLLKPLYFLNYLCVPMMALCLLYVFIRNSKINFSKAFIVAGILAVGYVALIMLNPVATHMVRDLGYSMDFIHMSISSWAYVGINLAILLSALYFENKRGVLRQGMWLMMASAAIAISETIMAMMGMKLMPADLLSELMWFITLWYGLKKVKKTA